MIKIKLIDWHHKCGDGCCDLFGTAVSVNGKIVDGNCTDASDILEKVLTHLGHKVEIETNYDYE